MAARIASRSSHGARFFSGASDGLAETALDIGISDRPRRAASGHRREIDPARLGEPPRGWRYPYARRSAWRDGRWQAAQRAPAPKAALRAGRPALPAAERP